MKKIALLALALAAASPAAASVTYDFESYLPYSTTVVTSFSVTVNDFLTADHSAFTPGELDSCSSTAGACGNQYFDRQAPGNDIFHTGHDTVISEAGQFGVFHFLEYGAFTTVGTHFASNPDIGVTGKLVVSQSVDPVPEPGEWAMMAAGLGAVGLTARRRRRG